MCLIGFFTLVQDIVLKFGKRVKKLRNEKGWSQEHMAHICGFDRTYIGRVERGERNLSLRNIERICVALEVSISEIFDGV
ncbi:MAG: helix-turn-helix domain-containing protein [bacterium]|nr:helix-turn-helix domain-containing protein [bacterium]